MAAGTVNRLSRLKTSHYREWASVQGTRSFG